MPSKKPAGARAAPAKRSSGGKSAKKGGGGGAAFLLYGAVIAGGLYAGVRAYSFRSRGGVEALKDRASQAIAHLIPGSAAEPRRDPASSDRNSHRSVRSGASEIEHSAPRHPAHRHSRHADSPAGPEPAASHPEPAAAEHSVETATTDASPTAITPLPPTEIDRGSGLRKEVALTFDAGADAKPARQILDTLAQEGVKTTFFLTGEWVRRNPKTAQRIAAEGHEIGNHSWNHPAFTHLSDDAIRDQLRRTESIIRETAGTSSHPYFRPPLGDRDSRVLKLVGDEGFFTIYWSLDSRDSVDKGITAEQIRDRVLGKTGAGSIVLMHCGSQASADALPEILRGLKARGLTPVPISRLLAQ